MLVSGGTFHHRKARMQELVRQAIEQKAGQILAGEGDEITVAVIFQRRPGAEPRCQTQRWVLLADSIEGPVEVSRR